MTRLRIAGLITAILLASCSGKGFEITYANLSLEQVDSSQHLRFSIAVSDMQSTYNAMVTSPSGLLCWDVVLEDAGDGFLEAVLDITPGASFESGDYSVSIMSSQGGSADIVETLRHEEVDVHVDDEGLLRTGGRTVTVLMDDGTERTMRDGEPAESAASASFTDGNGNSYHFTLSGRPSP